MSNLSLCESAWLWKCPWALQCFSWEICSSCQSMMFEIHGMILGWSHDTLHDCIPWLLAYFTCERWSLFCLRQRAYQDMQHDATHLASRSMSVWCDRICWSLGWPLSSLPKIFISKHWLSRSTICFLNKSKVFKLENEYLSMKMLWNIWKNNFPNFQNVWGTLGRRGPRVFKTFWKFGQFIFHMFDNIFIEQHVFSI